VTEEENMSWETDRFDWSLLRAIPRASGVPDAIDALERASTAEDALNAYWQIDNVVVIQGAVYEAGLATIPCLLSCLQRCTGVARPEVLELLVQIGGGEVALSEIASGNRDLATQCLREVARGFPLYLSILEQSKNPDERWSCVDLLGLSARADPSLMNRVAFFLKQAKMVETSAGVLELITNWEEGVRSQCLPR
jgi:hypothetical protein